MAYLDESNADWDAGIYQIETTDPVMGGNGGIANRQALELAKRTRDLKETKVDKVSGKELSTNDYTDADKVKLATIDQNANNYQHPDTHSAEMIDETTEKQFVSQSEKNAWSNGFSGILELTDKDGDNNLRVTVSNGIIKSVWYFTPAFTPASISGLPSQVTLTGIGYIDLELTYVKGTGGFDFADLELSGPESNSFSLSHVSIPEGTTVVRLSKTNMTQSTNHLTIFQSGISLGSCDIND